MQQVPGRRSCGDLGIFGSTSRSHSENAGQASWGLCDTATSSSTALRGEKTGVAYERTEFGPPNFRRQTISWIAAFACSWSPPFADWPERRGMRSGVAFFAPDAGPSRGRGLQGQPGVDGVDLIEVTRSGVVDRCRSIRARREAGLCAIRVVYVVQSFFDRISAHGRAF